MPPPPALIQHINTSLMVAVNVDAVVDGTCIILIRSTWISQASLTDRIVDMSRYISYD